MGAAEVGGRPRIVCDTNVVVSALLFRRGRLSWLREAWRAGRVVPLASAATVEELLRVLAYPKFALEPWEREELLAEYLPYAEAVEIRQAPEDLPACRDPHDRKFLELAAVAKADLLVTGDRALLAVAEGLPIPIVPPDEARRRLGG